MSVLVTGASGAIGRRVVAGLLQRGVPVRATTRDPKRLTLPPEVAVFAGDLDDPASFSAALTGMDRVFLYADLADPAGMAAEFVRSGVRRVVLLSSSSVTFPRAEQDFNGSRFLRVEHTLDAAGLEHTFLRPGGFASNAARWRWSIKAEGAVPLPYPEAVQAPVHDADIADVAVAALTGDALVGASPVLTGPERLTLREQVDIIGSALGRPLSVIQQTEAQSAAMLSQHVPEVWVRQIIKDWRSAVGATPAISDEATRITGRPARTFREWVDEHLDLFG